MPPLSIFAGFAKTEAVRRKLLMLNRCDEVRRTVGPGGEDVTAAITVLNS